jgi:hypothetical protein
VAALSVPAGVVTVGVEDPGWPGRMTVAVTRQQPAAEAVAVMDALREAGAAIRGDIELRGIGAQLSRSARRPGP